MLSREEIIRLKKELPGKRIRLIKDMNGIHPIPAGTEGTVKYVDDIGTMHMEWDTGSTLGLIYGEDEYIIVS